MKKRNQFYKYAYLFYFIVTEYNEKNLNHLINGFSTNSLNKCMK